MHCPCQRTSDFPNCICTVSTDLSLSNSHAWAAYHAKASVALWFYTTPVACSLLWLAATQAASSHGFKVVCVSNMILCLAAVTQHPVLCVAIHLEWFFCHLADIRLQSMASDIPDILKCRIKHRGTSKHKVQWPHTLSVSLTVVQVRLCCCRL